MEPSQLTEHLCVRSKIEEFDEEIICFDRQGDIRLLVQAGIFVVSSGALRLASPVWRAMFDPKSHFMEASASNGEVSFEDDDHEALSILLNIAHLRFSRISSSLTYGQLLQIAVLCDKYDTVTLVRPWLPKWLDELKDLPDRAGHEEWLFIAWVFGDISNFAKIAKRLMIELNFDAFGTYRTANGVLSTENMPPGIIDSILNTREATIIALINLCYSRVDQLMLSNTHCCTTSSSKDECDALALGSWIKGLGKIDFWPRPHISEITTSVAEMVKKLKELPLPIYHGPCSGYHYRDYHYSDHGMCNRQEKFHAEIDQVLEDRLLSVMTDSFSRHLEVQSKKCTGVLS